MANAVHAEPESKNQTCDLKDRTLLFVDAQPSRGAHTKSEVSHAMSQPSDHVLTLIWLIDGRYLRRNF